MFPLVKEIRQPVIGYLKLPILKLYLDWEYAEWYNSTPSRDRSESPLCSLPHPQQQPKVLVCLAMVHTHQQTGCKVILIQVLQRLVVVSLRVCVCPLVNSKK